MVCSLPAPQEAIMRTKLTKSTIDAAKFRSPGQHCRGAFYIWDTATAGFGLRVYPSGRKVFIVTYRVRGKQRFHTVGRYGELGLEDARAEAHEVLGGARKGKDPSAVRLAGRKAPTVQLSGTAT
jgi:Arm DNA-binding domain